MPKWRQRQRETIQPVEQIAAKCVFLDGLLQVEVGRRDDPDTWVGPFRADEENLDGANHRRGFRWNFREPGGEEWMVRLLATDSKVWAMAEQMLGKGQLVQPERIRGIYCTLPYGDHPPQALGCHTDGHLFHLGVVGYIDDVPPNGGSFMVWPESHRAFYPTFTSQYLRDQDEAAYEKVRTAFNQRPPVDTHGQAGDIVFWHHRLGHMASPNTSRQLRQAVLYDFLKQDIEQTQQEPPQKDMWRDWSDQMRAIAI